VTETHISAFVSTLINAACEQPAAQKTQEKMAFFACDWKVMGLGTNFASSSRPVFGTGE
jgi:hypothetical protein